MLILIVLAGVPKSIRALRSLSKTDSAFNSQGDNWGLMEIPFIRERFFLLDIILETSMARANLARIGQCLPSEYFPKQVQSRMGSVETSLQIIFTVDVHWARSFSKQLLWVVPLGFSGIP